ncbi:MAG: MauE/DoxX family redox-associated membrane protein [Candidatus Binatia bacterium]
MDPALQLSLRLAFSLLLATSASHKARDLPRFRETLAAYELLPRTLVAAAAPAVVVMEALLAAMLLSGSGVAVAGAAVSALMLGYAAAIQVNLSRGRVDIDCGCMGPASRVPLGPGLVVRNLMLSAAAGLLVVPERARALVWLDAVGVVAALIGLAACWLALERMLALAPRIAVLRRKVS